MIKKKKKIKLTPKNILNGSGDYLKQNNIGYILVHEDGGMVMFAKNRMQTLMLLDAADIIRTKHSITNDGEAKRSLMDEGGNTVEDVPSYMG